MASRRKGFDDPFIMSFSSEWRKVAKQLKQYIKEEQEDEEQCIQSECEHSEVD